MPLRRSGLSPLPEPPRIGQNPALPGRYALTTNDRHRAQAPALFLKCREWGSNPHGLTARGF